MSGVGERRVRQIVREELERIWREAAARAQERQEEGS